MSCPAAEELGLQVLETSTGEKVDAREALKGKIVGLYFSASWCPPCVQFSPELNEFAGANAKDFVLILVTSDHDEQAFLEYSRHKQHFLRIPFENQAKIKELAARFGIYALPTLQIIGVDGANLTSWGRAAVTRNKDKCIQDWKQGGSGASFLSLLGLW